MLETRLVLTNTLGLHARAAAKLVHLAGRFNSTILLTRPESKFAANARSILDLLGLAASCGVRLNITIDGEDEAQALSEITALFASNFGEE